MSISILYRDDGFIAINKPSGLLVHRSPIDKNETQFAVQLLRDHIGQRVYPLHRLDKPTSGVLIFALSSNMASTLSATWGLVDKTYWAVTRGKVSDCIINNPITTKPDAGDTFSKPKAQSAETAIKTLSTMAVNKGFGKSAAQYPTTTFSLVKAQIQTGRKHQIRKHLKHINHPIVGDTRYGRGEINQYFRDEYEVNRLLLHCRNMTFVHPVNNQIISITAPETWGQQVNDLFTTWG